MVLKKKKLRNGIVKDLAPSFIVGGAAIGSSLLGGALQSRIPAGTTNPLTTTGNTLGNFVAPIAVIGIGNTMFREFRKTKKKLKGGRR